MKIKIQYLEEPPETRRNMAICRIRDIEEGITIQKLAEWFDISPERVRQILERDWSEYIKTKKS